MFKPTTMAVLWMAVLLGITVHVSAQIQMLGHDGSISGDLVDSQGKTLIIPDRNQLFPENGKLLNISFYTPYTSSPGTFQVVTLREEDSGELKVTGLTNWRTGDIVYKTDVYDGIQGWSYAEFTKGYLPANSLEFIGLLFQDDCPIGYTVSDCGGNDPFMSFGLSAGDDLYEGQIIQVTAHAECRRYNYLVPFLSDDKCINVTLTYSYQGDEINGYFIYNLDQTIRGDDSICWRVVAPPRPDGQPAVVELMAQNLPWGYEVAESGIQGEKPSYCVGSGLKVIDGGTGEFLASVCGDTPTERRTVFSKSNIMEITFYGDRAASFTGDVFAGLKSDARYPDESGGASVGLIVGVVVAVVAVFVIILVVVCCIVRAEKTRQSAQGGPSVTYNPAGTAMVSDGSNFKAQPGTAPPPPAYGPMGPPTQGYGQPMAPPSNGYGQPMAPPTQNYGQPLAPPTQGYGQPMAPPTQGYGQPMAPPTQGYGQPMAPPTQTFPMPQHYQPPADVPPPPTYDEVTAKNPKI